MKLFDLHCDTLVEIEKNKEPLRQNQRQLSTGQTEGWEQYAQIFAIWSDPSRSEEENYKAFFRVLAYAKEHFAEWGEPFPSRRFLLSVEGGRLLGDDLSRLDTLKRAGVRILTPVWGGTCRIGGAHDTKEGLTPFGREVIRRCHELAILTDLSHASDALFWDTAEMAKEDGVPILATHSCARAIQNHSRNLTDEMLSAIAQSGGIVGVTLVTPFLGGDTLDDVEKHIAHCLSVCGEDAVCLGCDFDGTSDLPREIQKVGDMTRLWEKLSENRYSERLLEKIFYSNARNFFDVWNHDPESAIMM